MFLSVCNSLMYIYEQDQGCSGIWLSSRWSLRKERGLLYAEVVEKEREMMRGRTDRKGGKWRGWKYRPTLGSDYKRPLIYASPRVCVKEREKCTYPCVSMNASMFMHSLYIHRYRHISLSVCLYVLKRELGWVRDALCSVTPTSHATGFNFSVSAALTSQRERVKAEETGEGDEGG